MSERYPGGIISKTAPVPTGPYENGTAPGIWTLEQQAEFVRQGIWPIAGNVPNYIEDVFQTWLYTGNGSTQTINNGIDLAGKGGLLWLKARSTTGEHALFDTTRGTGTLLNTDSTNAARSETGLASFNSDGFSFANAGSTVAINFNGRTFASWTFREQPKFFDVVTYTGNGGASQTINHNLGSAPGCMIVKAYSTTGNWFVYHRSLGNDKDIFLNTTGAERTGVVTWNSFTPTSTQFQITSAAGLNTNGVTYVAYLFAHNAGGFGLSGTDNVISCGSYTGNGSATGPVVTLGYEPQWVLLKNATTGTTEWVLLDNMRGMAVTGNSQYLRPNSSGAESGFENFLAPTATGFQVNSNDSWINSSGNTYIYIAIRRGPMKTPTTGTSVFAPVAYTGNGTSYTISGLSNTPDLLMGGRRTGTTFLSFVDRLRGFKQSLFPYGTGAEATSASTEDVISMNNNNVVLGTVNNTTFNAAVTDIAWIASRAPGFFDEVCYTGNSTAGRQVTHNLGVAPELMIVKRRSGGTDSWYCYAQPLGNAFDIILDQTRAASSADDVWVSTSPTATNFTVNSYDAVNGSGFNYVAYLFASCPGVSKVGSYTGTGATQTVNCGFTAGARFVLIKATSTTGNWLVWDSARGIVAGNDPYLALNSTAAEVTNTDWVDTAASGFELSNAGGNLANSNGVNYIFLAIA